MASTINLAVIPGDGIGPEVIAEALKVALQRTGHRVVKVTAEKLP